MPGPIAASGALLELNFEESAIVVPPVWPLESVNTVLINELPVVPFPQLEIIFIELVVGYELIEVPGATPGVGKIIVDAPEIFMCPGVVVEGGPVATAGISPATLIPIDPPVLLGVPLEIPLEGFVSLTPSCMEVFVPE